MAANHNGPRIIRNGAYHQPEGRIKQLLKRFADHTAVIQLVLETLVHRNMG